MQSTPPETKRIVVAGASGLLGRGLARELDESYDMVGLTRDPARRESTDPAIARYDWVVCDLFSRKQTQDALAGADYAVYLVHSMTPSSAMTQGSFRDMDVICADNFARAADYHDVEQIVYVSVIVEDDAELSEHLANRLEVERALRAHGNAVTTLRAGLIFGAGGSTATMTLRLADRLPMMICPAWTETPGRPIASRDVVELIDFVLGNESCQRAHYDIGGPDVMTYREILEKTAELMEREVRFVSVPFQSTWVSVSWVSLIGGLPGKQVRPLVESLTHDMVPHVMALQEKAGQSPVPFEEAMGEAVEAYQSERAGLPARTPSEATGTQLVERETENRVRSVQRLPRPSGRDATWIAEEYARWLPRQMRPFLKVEVDEQRNIEFFLRGLPWPLLKLDYAEEISESARQVYWITGGLLARPKKYSRLEFREALDGEFVLAAIHDFRPRLPWLIYKFTQALVHLWVMHAFARYLGRQDREAPPRMIESNAADDADE